jgi:predicted dehydrogenase
MKILIIGLGSIGKKHVKAIKSVLPDAEIFALRSKRDAEKHSDVTNIYSLDEIGSPAVDFTIVANPTSEHKKTISQLIKYSFPLFIEKPIYHSLDIEDLVNSVNSKGIQTYVACNLRFLDCIKFIKEKLPQMQNNKINEVNAYCGSYLPEWRPNIDFRKSYSAIAELGGGVHIDLIHELDYLYWLFGTPKEVKRNFRSQSSLSLSLSSFDYANYLLDYEGFCASIVLNYYRRDPKRSLELVFDDETWSIDLLKNQITCNNQTIFSSEQRIADTYQKQMEYFINCLSKKNNTFNTISDAYNVLKICLNQ